MVVGLLALAGCEQKQAEAPKPFAPPALWRIEVVEDSGGQTGVVQVCANPEVVSSFSRLEPNINGAPCQLMARSPRTPPTSTSSAARSATRAMAST